MTNYELELAAKNKELCDTIEQQSKLLDQAMEALGAMMVMNPEPFGGDYSRHLQKAFDACAAIKQFKVKK